MIDGDKIRLIRLAHTVNGRIMTQRDLAYEVNTSESTINEIESGKRTRVGSDILEGIARVFGCEMDFLMKPDPLRIRNKRRGTKP